MTVAVIVQARLGSTRLPAKVLLPLPNGRSVLEEVLFRCHQIPGVDRVVCAVSEAPGNQILLPSIIRGRATLVIGSETDVLSRYAYAASELGADIIMRITADCPLIDPEVCGFVLSEFRRYGGEAQYVTNALDGMRSWPHGFDCEVFSAELLRRADREATKAYDREHVTSYFPSVTVPIVVDSDVDRSHIRWTLDTLADYVTIWNEFKRREEAA